MKTLQQDLYEMADDIQIGGETCFRHMALCEKKGLLTAKQRRRARSLINQANKLLKSLHGIQDELPEVEYKELWN